MHNKDDLPSPNKVIVRTSPIPNTFQQLYTIFLLLLIINGGGVNIQINFKISQALGSAMKNKKAFSPSLTRV